MMGSKWAVVQHVAFEGPGLIARLADERGLELEVFRCDLLQPLPGAGELAGLVVMGGPMGVHDTSRYPFLGAELRLIAEAVHAGTPVLGVCLGAQLLAHALGARVYPGAQQEIGIGSVELTEEGLHDPVIGCLAADHIPVVHWHGETFDLPERARLLASSDLYAHQAFSVGACAYGFQFHVELEELLANEWREHLPEGVELPRDGRTSVCMAGEAILGAFFERAGRGRR
ncbi:MAG TPA: gamma-glutamyl-gamma-aminobutyrate hydrolase family protein [Solirubrobacteraceae bacterium]|jgi:GMP synthase (glutamine-hydrolysing)